MAVPRIRPSALVPRRRGDAANTEVASAGKRRGSDVRLRAVVTPDGRRRLDRRAVYRGEGLTVTLLSGEGVVAAEVIDLTPEGLGLVVTGEGSIPCAGALVTIEHTGPKTRGVRQRGIVRSVSSMTMNGVSLPRIGLSLIADRTPGGRAVERRQADRFACADEMPVIATAACPLFFREWLHFNVSQLSAGGMTTRTSIRNKGLLPGLELAFTLMVPLSGSHQVRGHITSVTHSGREFVVGVAWCEPSRELLAAVSEYLLFGDKTLTPSRLRDGGFKVGSVERAVTYDYAAGPADLKELRTLRLRAHQAVGRLMNATVADMESPHDRHSRHITCRFGDRIVGTLRVNYVDRDPTRSQYVVEGGHVFPEWLWEAGFVEGGAAAVDPDFQRAGLYVPLLVHTLRVAVQSGYRYLVIAVADDLLSLCEQMGFKNLDTRMVEPKPGWRFLSHLLCISADELAEGLPATSLAQSMASAVSFVGTDSAAAR